MEVQVKETIDFCLKHPFFLGSGIIRVITGRKLIILEFFPKIIPENFQVEQVLILIMTYKEIETAIAKNDGQIQFYNEVRFNEIVLEPDSILIVFSGSIHVIAKITKQYIEPINLRPGAARPAAVQGASPRLRRVRVQKNRFAVFLQNLRMAAAQGVVTSVYCLTYKFSF